MTAFRLTRGHFSGASYVYDAGPGGLSAILRQIAIDNARLRLDISAVADLTDNTTGTKQDKFVDLPVPVAAIDATSAGGADTTALNTTIGKIKNAQKVIATSLSNALLRIGLPMVLALEGSQASANTLPAQDLTSTGATGTSAATFASTVAALNVVKANQQKIVRAFNSLITAIGGEPVAYGVKGLYGQDFTLVLIPAVTSVAAGPGAVAKTDVDAFLGAFANNLASLAQVWNWAFNQGTITGFTDSTGGTSGGDTIAVITAAPLVGHVDVSTDSAPGAALNTLIGVQNNAIASLANIVNQLASGLGSKTLNDQSGGTVSTTLAAETASLAAATGAASATLTSVQAAVATFTNDISTLVAAVNELAEEMGVSPIVDNSGGTADPNNKLTAVPAATTADNTTLAVGVSNAALNTILAAAHNAVATIAAKLDEMAGSTSLTGLNPATVIAG